MSSYKVRMTVDVWVESEDADEAEEEACASTARWQDWRVIGVSTVAPAK